MKHPTRAAVFVALALTCAGLGLAAACSGNSTSADFGEFTMLRGQFKVAEPGQDYEGRIHGKGGLAPYYDWQITYGSLPGGLSIDDGGRIEGTLTADPGVYPFVADAVDSDLNPNRDDEIFAIRVGDPDAAGPYLAKADAHGRYLVSDHAPQGMVLTLTNPDADPADFVWADHDQSTFLTGLYLAAAAYRYEVNTTQGSLDRVRAALDALETAVDVTGEDGLLSRGYTLTSDQELCCEDLADPDCTEDTFCGGDNFPEVHPGEGGFADYQWIGDAGRQEYSAVLFGLAVAHDLVTASENSIAGRVEALISTLADHVWDNGFAIVDIDGEVTSGGDLSGGENETPNGFDALSILAWTTIAEQLTGEERFGERHADLIDRGYDKAIEDHLAVYRDSDTDWRDVHSAFLDFHQLTMLEDDNGLRDDLLGAFGDALWSDDGGDLRAETERNPVFHMLFEVPSQKNLAGRAFETLMQIQSYQDAPRANRAVDLRSDPDVTEDPDRSGWATEAPYADKRPPAPYLWNENPYRLVGGADDGSTYSGVDYLLAYWMARHYRYFWSNL